MAALLVLCVGGTAEAWFTSGHQRVAEAAVATLPESVPAFFRTDARAVGHSAVDPDLEKVRSLGELRAAESPEHYLDLERVLSPELPRSRYAFLDAIRDDGHSAVEVGLLPYAILEETQRLTLAFAEHRRWPEDPYIQRRALIYAGNLAHYTADLCQPLHTTIHHDGRAQPDGSSPFSGIHRLVDGLFERSVTGVDVSAPPGVEDLHRAIVEEFDASHALVDRVYELEPLLRAGADAGAAAEAGGDPAPAVVDFTRDRWRASVRFTASLFLYAWEHSTEVELPAWHDRPRTEREGGPAGAEVTGESG